MVFDCSGTFQNRNDYGNETTKNASPILRFRTVEMISKEIKIREGEMQIKMM